MGETKKLLDETATAERNQILAEMQKKSIGLMESIKSTIDR